MFKLKNIIGVVFLAIIIAIASIWLFLSRQYVVPVLMYHSISVYAKSDSMLEVSAQTFERQIHYLKKRNYNVLPLDKVIELVREKKKIPNKTLAITLDDGYKDNFTYAFPILKAYQIPATIFIITNEVSRPQDDRLSWFEIKKMSDSGIISIGSHALGPDPLNKITSAEELARQIFESKKIIEAKLKKDVSLFSYPEGVFDNKIRQLVIDAGYKGAVATNPGPDYPSDDIYALKRIRISENSANLFTFKVEASGFYTFMKEWKKKYRRNGKK